MIGGGFRDGEKAVTVTRGQCREVQALRSNHEEADTRMILHAKYVARTDRRLVIQSPDTDVLILSVSHFRSLGCPELWFRTGLKDRQRMIPVHDIAHALGEKLCRSLPGFWRHALEAMQDLESPDLESPDGHGWVRDEKHLLPLLMTKAPAPESLLELTTCKSKTSSCLRNCSCNNTGLSCTEGCYCMADDEVCKNPHGVTCTSDSEESDKE